MIRSMTSYRNLFLPFTLINCALCPQLSVKECPTEEKRAPLNPLTRRTGNEIFSKCVSLLPKSVNCQEFAVHFHLEIVVSDCGCWK